MPFALATSTGFDAQRLVAGSGRSGRMGCGMARAAARPPAVECRNSRRDTGSDT
jgi:hypothetical protein